MEELEEREIYCGTILLETSEATPVKFYPCDCPNMIWRTVTQTNMPNCMRKYSKRPQPQSYPKNYRPPTKAESRRGGLSHLPWRAHQRLSNVKWWSLKKHMKEMDTLYRMDRLFLWGMYVLPYLDTIRITTISEKGAWIWKRDGKGLLGLEGKQRREKCHYNLKC